MLTYWFFSINCLGRVLKLGWLGWHQKVPYKTAEAKFYNWTSFLKLFCTKKSCSLQKVSQKLLKMTIIETWKLESGSQYSQRNFKKPVTYFKYWVECVWKICHQFFLWRHFQVTNLTCWVRSIIYWSVKFRVTFICGFSFMAQIRT